MVVAQKIKGKKIVLYKHSGSDLLESNTLLLLTDKEAEYLIKVRYPHFTDNYISFMREYESKFVIEYKTMQDEVIREWNKLFKIHTIGVKLNCSLRYDSSEIDKELKTEFMIARNHSKGVIEVRVSDDDFTINKAPITIAVWKELVEDVKFSKKSRVFFEIDSDNESYNRWNNYINTMYRFYTKQLHKEGLVYDYEVKEKIRDFYLSRVNEVENIKDFINYTDDLVGFLGYLGYKPAI